MHTPRNTSTQFSLRSLLLLTTLFAVLFALLAALGISPQQTGVGVAVLTFCAVATAGLVESASRILGQR